MKDEKILNKIRKCLALAKSSNPHEAAAALRQAQKLMESHGVTSDDIDLLNVKASEHSAGTSQVPARWHQWLAGVVCSAFAVEAVYLVGMNGVKIQFIGIDAQAEIAGYAYDVLFRQLRKDRNDHVSAQKRCKKSTKTRRGDLFAEAWVKAVAEQVIAFSQPDSHVQLIKAWKKKEHPDTQKTASKEHKSKGNDWKSQVDGYLKGKEANLNHGVKGSARQQLEACS